MASKRRLILIDGLPGSGKSTIATQIAESLSSESQGVTLLLETQRSHPLHPIEPDDIGAAWPDIHLSMTPAYFSRESLDRWARFIGAMNEVDCVIESFPFQSSVRVLMQMEAPKATILEYWNRWQEIAMSVDTRIVYLKELDPEGLVMWICRDRGEAWAGYFEGALEKMLYSQNRGWKGSTAARKFIATYSELMDELIGTAMVPVSLFEARPESYQDRFSRVIGSLGL